MKKLILIAGLLLASNGHTHDELFPTCPSPHDPHSADAKENIQPHKAISKKPPIYPNRALTRGLEGSVILEYTINTEGRAIDIKVVDTSNTIFDRT
ncbi:MAG: TonB family protein, partial [Pseudomonadota bacterium]|nr:TonB family protein [Pseudomonadota bacterium]